ncbi:MAG: protein-glutamate O-methyltransferase CheR [Acidobacteriia bacterium]|nr:protein-glutamate O-methyltransferase CheR [Terriglobia bacterium]
MNAPLAAIRPDNLDFLRRHIYAGSGIVLETEKQYLLDARLSPIAREQGLGSLDDLCALLRATSESPLHRRVVEAMTTNETYFFREPAHYQALREVILPNLLQTRQTARKLSFWSAAASTGQEAYSLAMMLLEMGVQGWDAEILGTDLSSQVLERAQSGRYTQLEVNRGLPAALLLKYFRRVGLDWELKEEVRRMVRFQSFDLRSKMRAMGPFDVVFCRNILIYFDLATKKSILEEMQGTLFRGGHLLLGSTEAGAPLGDGYTRQAVGSITAYVAI